MKPSHKVSCILFARCFVPAISFNTQGASSPMRNLLNHNEATIRINPLALPKTSFHNKRGLLMNKEEVVTDDLPPIEIVEQEEATSLPSGAENGTTRSSNRIINDQHDSPESDSAENTGDVVSKIASYKELIIYISMTVIIWLSEPSLSLVDTTLVGKFASNLSSAAQPIIKGISPETIQLAALGPATMLCDNAFYSTYFLAMATTNQLAKASAQSDHSLQVKTTSHALGVGAVIGLFITIAIFAFGDSLLHKIIGTGGAMVNGVDLTKPIISYSWDYCKIRAIVAPLSIMGMIAQSVSLATLDTRTPAIAVLVAMIINVFGDIFLVARCGMGIRGAAIATAAASAASSMVLIGATRKKVTGWRSPQDKRPFISLPDLKSFTSFVKLGGPMFFVMIGKLGCYSAMTLRASDFGMLSLATHNIMFRIFFFLTTFGDSFSAAAQSFVPKALFSNSGKELDSGTEMSVDQTILENTVATSTAASIPAENKRQANVLLKRIFFLGSIMAVVGPATTKQIMERGGSLFTNDATILSLLRDPGRVSYMMGSILLHPFVMIMEGSLLATWDLKYLVGAYGCTITMMLSLLKISTNSFTEVWRALFSFQIIRFVVFGSRVFSNTREKASKSKSA
jgi:Na+-driven multidrug efflux pump